MKTNNSGILAFLLALIGIAAAGLSFMYIAKPNYEAVQTIKNENMQLQARLADLNQKQANREQYIADTEAFNLEYDGLLNQFPADMNQEITIMFLQGIKDSNDFDVTALALSPKEQYYTLGLGGGDASIEGAADTAEGTTEAATTEVAATESTDTTLAEGSVTESSTNYNCYRAVFPISYEGSYDSLKDVLNYVAGYSDRMTINTLDIKYDSTNDVYTGDMELYCYSVEGEDRPERTVNLDNVETGVDNIFDSGATGSSGKSDALNKYNENDGAAIESNYDFYAMLNPATSDVSAKVVGQNGAGKDASVISNSDDSVSTLSFEFYEKDGKNYCKYTLDNSKSYEAEVTSAEDVKILLQSSARKNSDDKVGIRVTINNTTTLPIYVKVSGDDSVSPRISVASTSGAVKVYK